LRLENDLLVQLFVLGGNIEVSEMTWELGTGNWKILESGQRLNRILSCEFM